MNNPEQHQMRLAQTHPSGAEEWTCPTCGRRFVMQWPPRYKRIVLERGDEYAPHSAIKGDMLQLGSVQIADEAGRVIAETSDDAPLSDEWRTWLDEAGFDDWWDNPLSAY